jgi:hypothetical protein
MEKIMTVKFTPLTAVILGLSLATPAFADLGGVGSPVTPSNGSVQMEKSLTEGDTVTAQPEQPQSIADVDPEAAALGLTEMPAELRNDDEATGKPVILIRFNQRNVNFQSALRKVVDEVDRAKAGAMYEVRSVLPVGSNKDENQRINRAGDANLKVVLAELKRLGVTGTQVRVSTLSAPAVKAQEVQIFVK